MPIAAVLALDPRGWFPFTVAKWWAVLVVVLLASTIAATSRARATAAAAAAAAAAPVPTFECATIWLFAGLLVLIRVSTMTAALDGLYAWIGTPIRHLGLLAWVVFGLTFAVGRRVGIDDMARRVANRDSGDCGPCPRRGRAGCAPDGYRLVLGGFVDAEYVRRFGESTGIDRAHSGALDVAISSGVLAAVVFVALATVVAGALRLARRGGALDTGLAAAVIAYAVQQQLLFPIAEIDPVFWLLTGIVVARAYPDAQGADDLDVSATERQRPAPCRRGDGCDRARRHRVGARVPGRRR